MIARTLRVCLVALVVVVSGHAMGQETSNLMQVITVKVRPGAGPQFEEFLRAFRDASRKQGLKNYWLASQSVSGEPTYTFNGALNGWSDLGNAGPQLAKAFGQKEADRLEGLVNGSVDSIKTVFYRTHPDLSVLPPQQMPKPPAAVMYFSIMLKPGMEQQYLDGSQKTREASLAVTPNSYYVLQMPEIGARSVRVIGLVQKWEDLEANPGPQQRVIQHFGADEGGKIVAMINDTVANLTVQLDRTRPDLSYQPEQN